MENIFNAGKNFFSSIYSYFIAVIFVVSTVFSFFEVVERPKIKTGEFDFSFVYEIDGEIKTIEGTYVCKFKGIDRSFDGAGRHWIGYIKDHDGTTCYYLKTVDKGDVIVELDFSPRYFMSDPDFIDAYDIAPEPYIYITSGDPDNGQYFELYEGDAIKMISFEYDPPIENKYGYFLF